MLVPNCATEVGCESWRQQGVCVVVRRELCEGLRLGSRVSVVGVPTHRLVNQSLRTHIDTTIEVCTCQWKSLVHMTHKESVKGIPLLDLEVEIFLVTLSLLLYF